MNLVILLLVLLVFRAQLNFFFTSNLIVELLNNEFVSGNKLWVHSLKAKDCAIISLRYRVTLHVRFVFMG